MKKILCSLFFLTSATAGFYSQAQTIIGLTSDDKVFQVPNAGSPGVVTVPIAVTGLTAGQTIAGMDHRPNTGEIFILGYNATNSTAQLYTLNAATGVATAVGATTMTLALGTGSIGFDFNPTVDRIRVVGANRKNYRLNPVTGALAATDLDLNYAVGDQNASAIPSIGACAYTNSYIGSETTTLYDYDEILNIFTTQIPPNNGTLNTIGGSGLTVNTAASSTDMDIYFNPMNGMNTAYFAANTGTSLNDNLYTVNLAAGGVANLGMIGAGLDVKDISIVIDRTVPANVTGRLIYALTNVNGNLISFDSDNPSIIRTIAAVTGITAGQKLVGMDVRPANRMLYALGYNSITKASQLYTINPATAVATAVNAAPVTINLDSNVLIGFDFNPTVDRIRVVNANGRNYRLNPNDGAIAATDLSLSYAAGDPNAGVSAKVGSVAYINSFAGAGTTILYGVDDSIRNFVSIVPPNNGTLNTLLANFLPLNNTDRTTDIDFYYDSTSNTNRGYLAANTGTSLNDNLYLLNTNGTTTFAGKIGYGIQVADITVQIDYAGAQPAVVAQPMIGITQDDKVFTFNASTPGTTSTPIAITGLATGMTVAGADYRPNTGELFILGYDNASSNAQLYTLNATTGAATAIGTTPISLNLGTGSVGFDFNPTVDRIRVVGANKKNYRLHPVTGAIAATDGDLAYAPGDPNAAASATIGTVAYTNSYIGSETTTLYDYDEILNVFSIQNPPNNGTLNTVGSSGIILNPVNRTADLDIAFVSASGINIAFLAANTGVSTNDNLYTVNLANGATISQGVIGAGLSVKNIAAVIERTLPAITGQTIYATTRVNGNLLSFDSDAPALVRTIATITGVTAGQQIVGMDFRPADRNLYALGYNASARTAQLYQLNTSTAAATPVNTTAINIDLDSATNIGFDFNPVVDRIRVVNSNGRNYRLNPLTGGVAATDVGLAYSSTDPNLGIISRVGSVAYINSYNGATTTTLFAIDDSLKNFCTIDPPNNGVLNTVAANILSINQQDRTTDIDFYYDSTTMTNKGYMVANINTSINDNFYTITTAGVPALVGKVGNGIPVSDIAVMLTYKNDHTSVGNTTIGSNGIKLYPNPATDVLHVVLPFADGKLQTVTISGITGQTVQQQQFDGTNDILNISIKDLPAGMYLLKMTNAGKQETLKFIKQ